MLGPAGGEYGIRGFIAAYDPADGDELWRFNTIPGPGEAGHETWGGDSWQRGGGSIWLTGSYDSGSRPDVLGHRQSRPGLERRRSPRRQPLHRLRRRPRPRRRQLEVALPVHPARRLGLGCRADPRPRRPRMGGPPAQAHALGQPQRLLLRARPGHRRVPARRSLRQGHLGERTGRKRPAQPPRGGRADPRGRAHLPQRARERRTGTRLPTTRRPACSTSPPGSIPASITRAIPPTRAATATSAASRAAFGPTR